MSYENVALYKETNGDVTELTIFYRNKDDVKYRLDINLPVVVEGQMEVVLNKATAYVDEENFDQISSSGVVRAKR